VRRNPSILKNDSGITQGSTGLGRREAGNPKKLTMSSRKGKSTEIREGKHCKKQLTGGGETGVYMPPEGESYETENRSAYYAGLGKRLYEWVFRKRGGKESSFRKGNRGRCIKNREEGRSPRGRAKGDVKAATVMWGGLSARATNDVLAKFNAKVRSGF